MLGISTHEQALQSGRGKAKMGFPVFLFEDNETKKALDQLRDINLHSTALTVWICSNFARFCREVI